MKRPLQLPIAVIVCLVIAGCEAGTPSPDSTSASSDSRKLSEVADAMPSKWSIKTGETVGRPLIAEVTKDHLVVLGDGGVGVYDSEDGVTKWEKPLSGDTAGRRVYQTGDQLITRDAEALEVRELASGDTLWKAEEVALGFFALTESVLAVIECDAPDRTGCQVRGRALSDGHDMWAVELPDADSEAQRLVLPVASNQRPGVSLPLRYPDGALDVPDPGLLVFGEPGEGRKLVVDSESGQTVADLDDWTDGAAEVMVDDTVVSIGKPSGDNCMATVTGVNPKTGKKVWTTQESRLDFGDAPGEKSECDDDWRPRLSAGMLLNRIHSGPHIVDPEDGSLVWQGGADDEVPVGFDGEAVAVVRDGYGQGDVKAIDVKFHNKLWSLPLPDGTVKGARYATSSQFFAASFTSDGKHTTVVGTIEDRRLLVAEGANVMLGMNEEWLVTAGGGDGTTVRAFRP
jgi:outer membrane protein assembly factor BamB